MAKTHPIITDAAVPRRRGFLKGLAAGAAGDMALSASPAHGAAPDADAGLIAAAAHFHELEAAVVAANADDSLSDDGLTAVVRAWEASAAEIEGMAPKTLPGLQAKASVMVATLNRYVAIQVDDDAGGFEGQAETHESFAMRFALDVLALTVKV